MHQHWSAENQQLSIFNMTNWIFQLTPITRTPANSNCFLCPFRVWVTRVLLYAKVLRDKLQTQGGQGLYNFDLSWSFLYFRFKSQSDSGRSCSFLENCTGETNVQELSKTVELHKAGRCTCIYGVFFLLEMEQRMLLQINEVNVSPWKISFILETSLWSWLNFFCLKLYEPCLTQA